MHYLQLVAKHWISLLLSTLVTAAVVFGLSFLPAQLYEAEVELLIVQEQGSSDSYTAQKAAEKLGANLANVVYSFDFLDRVVATGYVSDSMFSPIAKEKERQWENRVKIQVVPESSIMRIYGYGEDPGTAEDIANGVSDVLVNNASDYHGAGETVQIRKISGPITSTRPVKPNIPLNAAAGAVLGFMVVYAIHLLRFESQRLEVEQQQIHYQTPNTEQDEFPLGPPEYKVLDQFPIDGYSYGETVGYGGQQNDETVTMHDDR